MDSTMLPRLASEIDHAMGRISRFSHETPLLRTPKLDQHIQGEVWLKAECLQATGSFKIRGALMSCQCCRQPRLLTGLSHFRRVIMG